MRDDPAVRARGEEGMTLVELVIGGALVAVVLLLAGQMLISAVQTQGSVTGATRAATSGQLASDLIDRAVRESALVRVGEDRVDALTHDGGCVALAVVDGTFRRTTSTVAITTAPAAWPVLAEGVGRIDSTPFFSRSSAGVVRYSLRLRGADGGAVDIVSSVTPRTTGGSGSPCF